MYLYRCKKVYDGVNHAAKLFPNAWMILFITGLVKGMFHLLKFNKIISSNFFPLV